MPLRGTGKTHTGTPRSVFHHAHVAAKNRFTIYSRLRTRTLRGILLLRARGVLVRWWADEPIRDWLRVSIGTDEEMRALVGALKELI